MFGLVVIGLCSPELFAHFNSVPYVYANVYRLAIIHLIFLNTFHFSCNNLHSVFSFFLYIFSFN